MKIVRGGRLSEIKSKDIIEFISSYRHDYYIVDEVIEINIAYLLCLLDAGIIKKEEARAIANVLKEMKIDNIPPEMEDIHMVIESKIIEKLGEEIGGKIHTGKSRNDQVATALRMRLRKFIIDICKELIRLQECLINKSINYKNSIMPGFTHLQHAQPTTISHYLMAYFYMFNRHFERLISCYKRVNLSPMGAAALAGTGYPIDRKKLAEYLGFDDIIENTLDAVSTRDFILETISSLAIMMIDLSRIAEEIIIWASSEFNYIELPDEHSSTSSIMPQKKNPVTAEIIRAKCGDVIGDMISVFTIMKGLPLAYNLDMQELTPHLWNTCEISKKSLRIMSDLIDKIIFNEKRLRESVEKGYSVATELADMLVRNYNIAFRKAHYIIGEIIREIYPLPFSEVGEKRIAEIISSKIGKNVEIELVKKAINPEYNVNIRKTIGGPSIEENERMINKGMEILEKNKDIVNNLEKKIRDTKEKMMILINSL